MEVIPLSRPDDEEAKGAVADMAVYQGATPEQQANYQLHNIGSLSLCACLTVVAALFGIPTIGTNWLVSGIGLTLTVLGIYIFCRLGKVSLPLPEYRYRQALRRRRIVEVPKIVVELWDEEAGKHSGFARWIGYEQCRYEALSNVLSEVGHLLVPLMEECGCRDPEHCLSTTHLVPSTRARLTDNLRAVVADAIKPGLTAFEALLRSAKEQREGYNKLLRSE
jgi:hypothetical protein